MRVNIARKNTPAQKRHQSLGYSCINTCLGGGKSVESSVEIFSDWQQQYFSYSSVFFSVSHFFHVFQSLSLSDSLSLTSLFYTVCAYVCCLKGRRLYLHDKIEQGNKSVQNHVRVNCINYLQSIPAVSQSNFVFSIVRIENCQFSIFYCHILFFYNVSTKGLILFYQCNLFRHYYVITLKADSRSVLLFIFKQ